MTGEARKEARHYYVRGSDRASSLQPRHIPDRQLKVSGIAVTSTAIMSKVFVPSKNLLATFSRALRHGNPQPISAQCQRLSTITTPGLPRTAPQPSCLHSTPKTGARTFSTSPQRKYKTVQEQRSRYRSGVRPSLLLSKDVRN